MANGSMIRAGWLVRSDSQRASAGECAVHGVAPIRVGGGGSIAAARRELLAEKSLQLVRGTGMRRGKLSADHDTANETTEVN
jgi:hypothetical protein